MSTRSLVVPIDVAIADVVLKVGWLLQGSFCVCFDALVFVLGHVGAGSEAEEGVL